MAGVAGDRKLAGDVIRIRRVLVVSRMARIAVGRHGLELAVGCALVAGIAVDRGVSAGQGKAIVVLLHLLNRNCPAANRMALRAIRAQLPFMNIGVAVLAAQAYVREYRFHVTLDAGHGLVHAAQRIPCLVVIEFGDGADRLPRTGRVAVLARNIQITVRTVGFRVALRLQACRVPGKRQQKCRDQMKHAPRRQHDLSLNLGRGGISPRQPWQTNDRIDEVDAIHGPTRVAIQAVARKLLKSALRLPKGQCSDFQWSTITMSAM